MVELSILRSAQIFHLVYFDCLKLLNTMTNFVALSDNLFSISPIVSRCLCLSLSLSLSIYLSLSTGLSLLRAFIKRSAVRSALHTYILVRLYPSLFSMHGKAVRLYTRACPGKNPRQKTSPPPL